MGIQIDALHLLDYARQNLIHVPNHELVELYYLEGYEYPGIKFRTDST